MTTPLPTATIGRTSLQVTTMGLGTAPLGGLYHSMTQEQAEQIIQHALTTGIRYLDTAPLYGAGQSEQFVGAALAGVPRSSYVISTKVGRLIDADGQVYFDYTRDGVLRSVEASLQRLGIDSIDILLVHDPDDHYQNALDGAFPTLVELRDQGVIKAIGSGMNQWQMLSHFAREVDIDCFLLAGRYTLLEQTSLDEFLPLCQQKQISIIIGGVFNSGILAQGAGPGAKYNYADAPPDVIDRVRRLEAVCARFQVPLSVAALQFPKAHPAIATTLVGAESTTEISANFQAMHTPVPTALWDALRNEGLLHPDAPTP